jgi:hypothetical protein
MFLTSASILIRVSIAAYRSTVVHSRSVPRRPFLSGWANLDEFDTTFTFTLQQDEKGHRSELEQGLHELDATCTKWETALSDAIGQGDVLKANRIRAILRRAYVGVAHTVTQFARQLISRQTHLCLATAFLGLILPDA